MTNMDLIVRRRAKPRTELRRAKAEERMAGSAARGKGKRERGNTAAGAKGVCRGSRGVRCKTGEERGGTSAREASQGQGSRMTLSLGCRREGEAWLRLADGRSRAG